MRVPLDIEELFEAHAQDVLAYALRRSDHATADDVVAEVFAICWRKRAVVPSDEPLPWLYAVARRVLANQRRASSRRTALSDVLGVLARGQHEPAPQHGVAVLDALAALPQHDREILMLTAWEGLNARQASKVLGCSPAAVHTRLHRARGRLQQELGRPQPAPSPPPISEVQR